MSFMTVSRQFFVVLGRKETSAEVSEGADVSATGDGGQVGPAFDALEGTIERIAASFRVAQLYGAIGTGFSHWVSRVLITYKAIP